MPDHNTSQKAPTKSVLDEVVERINNANNILLALSSDPTVDELAAAIGMSIYLGKLGKHTTAIYSGTTPNALEFLKPEETFEESADSLQDFVVAIDKEKADHLRYKLDGDYVKVYITPYKSRIDEDDLEFSYGDFNVDLVIALNVPNGTDLDSALREHGRIMHDANIINITTSNPGKFGEIEWSEPAASSVSEITAKLSYALESPVEKDEATAYLTGIVAATNRFSNAKTAPSTMQIASRLMESGANHQLVSQNVTADVDNYMAVSTEDSAMDIARADGPISAETGTLLETPAEILNMPAEEILPAAPEMPVAEAPIEEMPIAEVPMEETPVVETLETTNSGLLDDLKAAQASLSMAGAEAIQEKEKEPFILTNEELVVTPPTNLTKKELESEQTNKYGEMIQEALNNDANLASVAAPAVPDFEAPAMPEMDYSMNQAPEPATIEAPTMPEMPTMPEPAMPETPITPESAMPPVPPISANPTDDAGAFKIPGM